MDNHIEEAKILIKRIVAAQSNFKYQENAFIEDEVRFRLDALRNILLIAYNDARQMLLEWEKLENAIQEEQSHGD